jgi:hypothetical protein
MTGAATLSPKQLRSDAFVDAAAIDEQELRDGLTTLLVDLLPQTDCRGVFGRGRLNGGEQRDEPRYDQPCHLPCQKGSLPFVHCTQITLCQPLVGTKLGRPRAYRVTALQNCACTAAREQARENADLLDSEVELGYPISIARPLFCCYLEGWEA